MIEEERLKQLPLDGKWDCNGMFLKKSMPVVVGVSLCLCVDFRVKGRMFRIYLSHEFTAALHFRQRAWVLH